MIEPRSGVRTVAYLVVGSLLFALAAPAFAEPPGAESPEALVERMKRAGENEDFGEMLACLEPEGRVQMASMMYLMATMMVGFAMMGVEMGSEMGESMAEGMGGELTEEQRADMEAQKQKARDEVAQLRDAYNRTVAEYGLPELSEEESPPDEDVEAILREVDHAAFIEDVMALLDSMPGEGEEAGEEEESPWAIGGDLTDLEIEGDTATGKIEDQEVTFVRIDGRWYFSEEMFAQPGGPQGP